MKNKIQFVLCLLYGLMFINAGANKLFNYIPIPDNLPAKMIKINLAIKEIGWLIPLLAVVEILGGLLFIFKRTRAFAAIMLFPIMVGIILTHILYEQASLPLVFVLLAIQIWVVYDNREKYLQIFQ